MAPVHIGSGKIYSSKEYIYENGYYYFPDMGALYKGIQNQGSQTTKTFEQFLMQSGNKNSMKKPRLKQFLTDQNIKNRDFKGYRIKENGYEQERKEGKLGGSLNDIAAFVRDPFGQSYIPGSSLKGAIRTILVNQYFGTDDIPWKPEKNQKFDSIFHQIRVSDSEIIPMESLSLAQKWDFSAKKNEAKPLPIHRESIKPMTVIQFTIDAVGDEAICLIEKLQKYAQNHYQAYRKKFLNDFPDRYIQNDFWYPIYVGAGSGFWSKTQINIADPSRHQKAKGKMKMKGNGTLKLTKAPNVAYKIKGEKHHLVRNNERLYEMGKCAFIIKEMELN